MWWSPPRCKWNVRREREEVSLHTMQCYHVKGGPLLRIPQSQGIYLSAFSGDTRLSLGSSSTAEQMRSIKGLGGQFPLAYWSCTMDTDCGPFHRQVMAFLFLYYAYSSFPFAPVLPTQGLGYGPCDLWPNLLGHADSRCQRESTIWLCRVWLYKACWRQWLCLPSWQWSSQLASVCICCRLQPRRSVCLALV